MEPLDLRSRPPRSPHVRLAGVRMLARTVDKARATLPGGSLGRYWIHPGLSAWLLGKLRISEDEFIAVVRDAASDDDVAAFVQGRVDAERIERIDVALGAITVADVTDDLRERFDTAYGPRPPDQLVIDVLADDDAKMFAGT